MKNIICLKTNVDRDEALELMDYLYCEKIKNVETDGTYIRWYDDEKDIAKWTEEYRNIMIDSTILNSRN